MISYLQKFNNLDPELKAKVSGEKVMIVMRGLENKYNVKLATIVMRLMVKDVSILDLAKFLKFEYDMDAKQAEDLVEELKERVLWEVSEHLGFSLDSGHEETIKGFKTGLGASTIKTSNFFFSSEDEDEVKELTKKLETFKPVNKAREEKEESDKNIDEMAGTVRMKMRINFSAQELNERFSQIIKTYLKGVRGKIDTKQSMMKAIDSGGLDFNDALSSRAIKIADEVKSGEVSLQNLKVEEKSNFPSTNEEKEAETIKQIKNYSSLGTNGLRDVDYDFSKLKEKTEEKKSAEDRIKPMSFQEVNNLKSTKASEKEFRIDLESLKKIEQEKRLALEEKGAGPKNKEENLVLTTKSSQKNNTDGQENKISNVGNVKIPDRRENARTRVEDVKFVPRLTGPIDELKEMSLTDFRRLGVNSQEIIGKIIQKIDNLEKESYEKRMQGIQAWRQSPVNKIYLGLAKESIGERKKVNDLIIEWRDQDKEVIKPEEFSAILDLNKQIRY